MLLLTSNYQLKSIYIKIELIDNATDTIIPLKSHARGPVMNTGAFTNNKKVNLYI